MHALGSNALAGDTQAVSDTEDLYAFLIKTRNENNSSTATISAPVNGATVQAGVSLTLSGSTDQTEIPATYHWDVNGTNLNNVTPPTDGATSSVTLWASGPYTISLTLTPIGGGTVSTKTVNINVNTTPAYSHSDFDPLSHFTAAFTSSQTMCPTISNSGTGTLTLSFAAVQAASSSADFSGYFELGNSASCPATPRPCNTSQVVGNPISGATSLVAPSDTSCTLALRFNPSKFIDNGDYSARSATLEITHNGTIDLVPLSGIPTHVAQPILDLYIDPQIVNNEVTPPIFASQVVNTTSAVWTPFFVINTGDANGLDLNPVTHTNTQEFILSEDCGAAPPLAKASGVDPHCTISLRFRPTTTGKRCTTVTVSAVVGGTKVVPVCGTGVPVPEPDLTLSRDTIDFGRRFISAAYPPQSLTISNGIGATANLQITATMTGSGFTLMPDPGSSQASCANASLVPGASCTLQVQFTPDPTRPETAYNASLLIDTNDVSTPHRTVALTAIAGTVATPPVLQFTNTPTEVAFADYVVAGQQSSQTLTLSLRNAGPGNATIDAIRTVGADASSFSITGCPATLFEGATCDISLRFTPGSGGLKRAQLEVVSVGSVPPPLLTVTGRAIGSPSAFLTASSASISTGGVRIGASSVPVELRLASAGDGVVQVTRMEVDGPFTVQSKSCPSVPFTMPRGGDCTVTIVFAPTTAGTAAGSLRISTDSVPNAVEVKLAGSGEQAAKVSGGGCSMASGETPFDPTLWALVALAIAAIAYRRRARAVPRREP